MFSTIFLLLFSACSGKNKQDGFLYNTSKSFFPTRLTDHIPEVYNSRSYFITTIRGVAADTVMPDFAPHKFILINKYSGEDFKKEYEKISRQPLIRMSVNDTNQILIGSSLCLKEYDVVQIGGYDEGVESIKVIERNMRNKDGIPLPIFEIEEFIDTTSTRLNKNFVLFILDYHYGKVLKSGSCKKMETDIVPPKSHNGYSRGYAISIKDKTVIYWIVAW